MKRRTAALLLALAWLPWLMAADFHGVLFPSATLDNALFRADGTDGAVQVAQCVEDDSGNFAVAGALTARRSVEAVTGANTITAAESGKAFTNEGASGAPSGREWTLPPAVAGLWYEFISDDPDGLRIRAVGDDFIDLEGAHSVAGGYVETTTEDAELMLIATSSIEWHVTTIGSPANWNIDGAAHGEDAYIEAFIASGDEAFSATITAGSPLTLAGTLTVGEGSSGWTVTSNALGGTLTYTAIQSRAVTIEVSLSFTADFSNRDVIFFIAHNGVALGKTEKSRKIATGTDLGAVSLSGIVRMSTGDTLRIFGDVGSGTGAIQAEHINILVADAGP